MNAAHRSRALALGAALVLALGVVVPGARAWTPIDGSRPVWAPPVPYSLNNAGSADLPIDTLEPIVQRGFEDWTRVACGTSLTVAYGGRTSARASVSGSDGLSIVSWVESGWRHGSGAIGVTGPKWSRRINEADMEMNGQNYTWIEGSGRGSTVNTYSIVAHEAGHYFGLGHSSDARATMYYAYSGGVAMLNADDANGICSLYPGGSTPADCSVTGCPTGQVCTDGMCVTMTGDGSVCSPCSSGSDCAGAGSYCLGYPSGGYFCGRNCTSSADCDASAGDICADLGGVGQCVRLVGGQPDCSGGSTPSGCSRDSDCAASERCNTTTRACEPRPAGAALGAPCSGPEACASGLCVGGSCSQTCDWLNTTSCPAGFYCDGDFVGTCNDGVCRAGSAGGSALGASCAEDTQCASLFCSGGVCAQPCVPGGAATCPAGYACQVGATPTCGACKTSGALGDLCESNDDCTSGICATLGDRRFCTDICDTANPCPARYTCTSAGAVSVCVGDAGGLGEDCTSNTDCLSDICARDGSDSYCTRLCSDGVPCPTGFACTTTSDGATRICSPAAPRAGLRNSGGCGCDVPGRAAPRGFGASLLVLALVVLGLRRRARR
jgi:hypothetical protein